MTEPEMKSGFSGRPVAIVYLHGFLSSPLSQKSHLLEAAAAASGGRLEFHAPDLNLAPFEVDALLQKLASGFDPDRLVLLGSSLGGFYAGRLARMTGARAVFVNPCFDPWNFVPGEVGHRQIYGTDRFVEVLPSFADDMRELARRVPPEPVDPSRALAILSTADEVLDWNKARRALSRVRTIFSVGDNHRCMRFAEYVPAVTAFALEALPPEERQTQAETRRADAADGAGFGPQRSQLVKESACVAQPGRPDQAQ